MAILCGVDPGIHGAFAFLAHDGALVAVHDMPTATDGKGRAAKARVDGAGIAGLLRSYAPSTATVERVGAMPGQGVSSTFVFGEGAGIVRGALAMCDLDREPIRPTPRRWKRDMGLTADKDQSRAMAAQMFPAHAALFRRAKDDGRAEAALLGVWWLRHGDAMAERHGQNANRPLWLVPGSGRFA